MSSTFNGHIPPEIIPDSAHLSWNDPRPKYSFVLTNKSAWPIVYKIKVQQKLLGWSEVFPAQGIVGVGSSCVISLKLELRAMRENGLVSRNGHNIHVESWYISPEDSLRSDPAKLLLAIKKRVENPRKPDTSVFQIRYVSPSRQDTLPSIPQTSRQPPMPRSMTIPHSFQPVSEPVPATPAISIIPPSRQQTLASLSSNADSPAAPTSTSQPTVTHEQIAQYISEALTPTLRGTKSSSSSVADLATTSWSTSTCPSIPIPTGSGRDNSPTSSAAGSFTSAREGNTDPGSPFGDAMDIDPPIAALTTGALPPTSQTLMQSPFAEPTTQFDSTWAGPQPSNAPSPLDLSPTRETSPDTADGDWMKDITVDGSYRGKVSLGMAQGKLLSPLQNPPVFSSTESHEVSISDTSFQPTGCTSEGSVPNQLPLNSTNSTKVSTTEGVHAYIIPVEDIALEGSDPVDVSGHFSDLFVGVYRETIKVALKRLRIGSHISQHDARKIERFEREAEIWTRLRHSHVLPFLGIYKASRYVYLTSPLMENGNLAHYIEKNPDTERSSFLLETAEAVVYLHSQGIVHGDIKARNILVSGSRHALLCDFGLAKWASSITASASKGMGTARWQSPELLKGESRCFASDIYAFGITIAEVLSGKIPFGQFPVEAAAIHAVLLGTRPALEPTHSSAGHSYKHLWDIATRCWAEQESDRPAMVEVSASLPASGGSLSPGTVSNMSSRDREEPVLLAESAPGSAPSPIHNPPQ